MEMTKHFVLELHSSTDLTSGPSGDRLRGASQCDPCDRHSQHSLQNTRTKHPGMIVHLIYNVKEMFLNFLECSVCLVG